MNHQAIDEKSQGNAESESTESQSSVNKNTRPNSKPQLVALKFTKKYTTIKPSQWVPIGVIRPLLKLIIIYKLHNNHLLIPRNVSYRYALGHCVNQLNHEGFYVRAHFLHDVACFCTYSTVGMIDRSMTAHSLHFHHVQFRFIEQ